MRNKIYLTSAFSLSMVTPPVNLRVEEVPTVKELREIVEQNDVEFRIGHQSTAQVLSEMLGKRIEADRTPVKVIPGDTVIVFQLLKRPNEGQVYTEEEIREILARGLFKILKVEVS